MSKTIELERRMSERYDLQSKVVYELSAELDSGEKRHAGTIVNISSRGVCVMTKKPLVKSQIIRMNIPLPEVKVSSPTLAEVCWVEELKKKKKGFLIGLIFLL